MLIATLLIHFTFLLTSAFAQSNPGACSGQCWSHDPSVIRRSSDGVYFRFETGSLIGIWKADDLTGPWVYQGAAIPNGSIINLAGNDDLWAPDVHLVGDTYILYYAVSTFGVQNSAIGYATSSTMEAGSWTDHGSTGVSSTQDVSAYNAIDPNLVQDASSGAYSLSFGSFWNGINQVTMSSDATSSTGAPFNIVHNSTGEDAIEGPFVYYRSGWYYLFFSSGQCCGYDTSYPEQGEEYKIFVCRSQSVGGPYVDRNGVNCLNNNGGTLVLGSHGNIFGPGGQGVMADSTHGTVLYYHYANTDIGLADADYQFGWNTLSWSSGWPSV